MSMSTLYSSKFISNAIASMEYMSAQVNMLCRLIKYKYSIYACGIL